jgi:hypothetical protein
LSLHALFRALFTCKFADGHGIKTFLTQNHFCKFEQSTLELQKITVDSGAQIQQEVHPVHCVCTLFGHHDKTRQVLGEAMF